jgi:hypothetical protein
VLAHLEAKVVVVKVTVVDDLTVQPVSVLHNSKGTAAAATYARSGQVCRKDEHTKHNEGLASTLGVDQDVFLQPEVDTACCKCSCTAQKLLGAVAEC